jgi:uncharacterized protein (DUF924 family)
VALAAYATLLKSGKFAVISSPTEPRSTTTAPTPGWVAEVLQFWFREIAREQWFKRDAALDDQIRARFLALHDQVSAMPNDALLSAPRTALAAVIVLDQFSRNMFRGSPRAFAGDAKALALADAALAKGYAASLSKDELLFFYLPFEHSETHAAQLRCVELMSGLGDAELTRYAQAHYDIIERFGRFPHRNEILGRTSTAEEIEFLKQPGSSF